MIIVISHGEIIPSEAELVNEMFSEGLDVYHLRKPFIGASEMDDFLKKLDRSFISQVALHSHFELAEKYGISRLHFREESRINSSYLSYYGDYTISTSTHDIITYNGLGKEWQYAFLSPFFSSISKKGYGKETTIPEDCKERDNVDVKLIALGGIHEGNIAETLNKGVDGIALLGAVWQAGNPLEAFRKCRRVLHNYVQNKSDY